MHRRFIALATAIFIGGLIGTGGPVGTRAQDVSPTPNEVAYVAIAAYSCQEAVPLEEAPAACTRPEAGISITYEQVFADDVEPVTVVTDSSGAAMVEVRDPEEAGRYNIDLPGNVLYYPANTDAVDGYGSYVMSCARAAEGDDSGFSYSGTGFFLDDLETGDAVSCDLYLIPPVGYTQTSPESAAPEAPATIPGESPAGIYAGTCDPAGISGEPIADLEPVSPATGNLVGAAVPAPVERSESVIDVALSDLLEEHVLVVFDQDDPTVALACGAIGGIVDEDNTLAIGLPALGASRYSGVAQLRPVADGTEVIILLASGLNGEVDA